MKKFLVKFLALFVVIYAICAYYRFYVLPNISGDIGKLGKIPFGKSYILQFKNDKDVENYFVHNVSYDSLFYISEKPVVMTIGDSFSQQKCYGYQQYIAKKLDLHVYNIDNRNFVFTPEQFFVNMLNNGLLPEGSVVIVESVQRCVFQCLLNVNLMDTSEIFVNRSSIKTDHDKLYFGLEQVASYLRLLMGVKKTVVSMPLSKDLFSLPPHSDKLYVYNSAWDNDGDLMFVDNDLDIKSYNCVQENLRKLKELADDNGVVLIYMVAANKYDVYSDYIINNQYPLDKTLDVFSDIDSTWFVNTKTVLQPYVANGVKDVYYVNDTHWSPVGAKIVGEYLADLMIEHYMD